MDVGPGTIARNRNTRLGDPGVDLARRRSFTRAVLERSARMTAVMCLAAGLVYAGRLPAGQSAPPPGQHLSEESCVNV